MGDTQDQPKRRAYVLRDFSVVAIEDALDSVRRNPPEGWEVKVSGPDTDLSKGLVFFDAIRPDLVASDKIIAHCERSNANVGFEIGFALGIGKLIVLATSDSVGVEHLRTQAPFQGLGILAVQGPSSLKHCIAEAEGLSLTDKPAPGEATLFVCPPGEHGEAYRTEVIKLGLPWQMHTEAAWQLRQLPAMLEGIARVVWTIGPVLGPNQTQRDGPGNTACAAIAGFAFGHNLKLDVLRRDVAARDVADVQGIGLPFKNLDEFIQRIKALDKPPPVRVTAPRKPAEVLASYREFLVASHTNLVPFFGDGNRRLEDVFVQIAIERRDVEQPGDARRDPRRLGVSIDGKRESLGGSQSLHQLLSLPADPDADVTGRWLVLGGPGAGKSTLCRELCHRLGGEQDGPLPVLVPLSGWMAASEGQDPFDWIEREARAVKGKEEFVGLAGALRTEAERSDNPARVWMLFDGLDEVGGDARPRALKRIDALARQLEHAVVLVTSRPAGVERDRLPGFREARLLPLSEPDQKSLLNSWLGPEKAARAQLQITERPRMAELARNPLLLTLLAKLVDEGGELWDLSPDLPRTRSGLYGRALDLLLRRGFGSEKREGVKDRFAAQRLLAELSLQLLRDGGETWPKEALVALLWKLRNAEPELQSFLETWDRSPEQFLEDVGRNSGVLGPHDGPGAHWRYLHRSLREYLAALAILEKMQGGGVVEPLVQHLKTDTPRWGEVVALVCGLLKREDPHRAKLLEELVSSDHDLATRTLPELEGLGIEEALGLLDRVPKDNSGSAWDGEDLRRLLTGLVLEGHPRDNIRSAVMKRLDKDLPTEALAYRFYALERSGVGVARADFFGACGRWPAPGTAALPTMVRIPSGTALTVAFRMGSPEDEPKREGNEGPQHEITLAAFLLAASTVTEAQYAAFDRSRSAKQPDHPVVDVSWWDAWLYCRWIGADLPTEAQWECACRAGTTTPWSTGSTLSTKQANISRKKDGWDFDNKVRPVRAYRANPWDLFDMHGNIWQWCRDAYGGYELPVRVGDGERIVSGAGSRVIRGGSFNLPARYARSAFRYGDVPSGRLGLLGFRPAMGITTF